MTGLPPALQQALDGAVAAYRAGALERAESSCRRVVVARPDCFEAIQLLAAIRLERGDAAAALAGYERAIALRPDQAEAHYNRGVVLQEMRRLAEALAAYERALALKPDLVEALTNRGNVLTLLQRHEEALASYERAIALRPDFAEAIDNRGVALYNLRRFEEALACHERALALRPESAVAFNNRANALHELRRHDEALASYARAIELKPDYAEARWNEGLARLRLGDFRCGWRLYEWGWQAGHRGAGRRFGRPRWTGQEPLAGKTLLLHAEQGFGDAIQFVRYAPLAARAGARVIIEAYPALAALFAGTPGLGAVVRRGSPLPAFDFHCPLLSLPLAFGTELDTIPAHVPYLVAPAPRQARWKDRLSREKGLRVGIAWAGRATPDPGRSMRLAQLTPLFGLPGIRFVSLQKEVPAGDEEFLGAWPGLLHFGPELADFADTAALIAQLDLVISIDTAAAHLAGALGRPVWILLQRTPDWRWLLEREDSPWYPTARLFRQDETWSWDAVLARVRDALRGFAA